MNNFDTAPLTGAELEQSLALQARFMVEQMLAHHLPDERLESFRLNFIKSKIERLSGDDLMEMEMDAEFRDTAVQIFSDIELGMTWKAACAAADIIDQELDEESSEGF